MEHVDVAVVGAGITGLRVAHGLASAGWSVRVLEARPEVGGRLRTVDGLDLGASWFWPNEPRVQALIADLGLATHPHPLAGDALYQDPRGVQRLSGNAIDAPCGRFSDGAATLARELARRLPDDTLRTGTAVHRIRLTPGDQHEETAPQGGAAVRVEWPGGAVAARHAVVALPPALAAHGIDFEPELPPELARLAAAVPVWMANTTKVVVRYDEAFWVDDGLAGAAISHSGPLREIHDLSGPDRIRPALFGFAAPLAHWATDEPRDAVIEQLTALFGVRARNPLRVEMVDWSREPHAAPPGAERLQRYDLYGHPLLSAPIHGHIHLASTETAPAFAGHIEGALVAAEAVLTRIGPRGPV
jgi:monoamine oxidase